MKALSITPSRRDPEKAPQIFSTTLPRISCENLVRGELHAAFP